MRNAYWDLVYAIQAVEAAQNSLDLASKLVQDNQARVEIGTLAPIDVVSAQAEAGQPPADARAGAGDVRTSELALKRLIVSGTDDPLWTSSINPVDRPPTTAEPINLEAAVTRALRERTDLQQSKNNLKISDINLRNQVDLTRPQLNLTASYGLSGLGGPIPPATAGRTGTAYPSGLLRRAAEHPPARRADVDARVHLRLSARPERAGGERRAIEAVARADRSRTSRRWSCRSRPT